MKKLYLLILCVSTFYSQSQIPKDIGTQLVATISGNVGLRHADDGSGRKFIIDQSGTIRVLDAQDKLLPTPFLDISNKVRCCGERGLLGLAFHPDYENNGYFFVNYTKESPNLGDTIIERYQVSQGDINIADPNSGVILMRIIQDYSNHNGGNISFGPDGYLYIGMGDGGSGGDPQDRAQDLGSALGKMLRIDVDSNDAPQYPAPGQFEDPSCPQDTGNYSIPISNPFVNNQGACSEIWSYGLRNPWRWSFDRETGDVFIGDVGQNIWEEINFQGSDSTGGEHYGWNCREGAHDYNGGADCDDPLPTMVEPILEYDHSGSRCSITGGYNYKGPVISLTNRYIYGDYCTGQIWIATRSQNTWSETEWVDSNVFGNIVSFGEDEVGHVYISLSNGELYRITGDLDDLIFEDNFESPMP